MTKKKRNSDIVELVRSGVVMEDIATKYGLTSQRVQQLSKEAGVMVHDKSRKGKLEIMEQIKKDMTVMTYGDIRKKYGTCTKYAWQTLNQFYTRTYGENIVDVMRDRRNELIIDKYSSGDTAEEVLASDEMGLKSPIHFTGINNIYRVASNGGFKKYPTVKNRAAGGSQEDPKIIRMIVRMRENNKKNKFYQIADALNKKGIRTIQGVEFSGENVNKKYNMYVRDKK